MGKVKQVITVIGSFNMPVLIAVENPKELHFPIIKIQRKSSKPSKFASAISFEKKNSATKPSTAIHLPNHWTHPHIVPGNNKSCTCFRTAFEIRCRPSKRPAPSSPGIDLGTAQSVGTMGPVVGRIVGSQYVLQFNDFSPPAHLKSTKSEHILLVRFSCDSVIYITVYI